MMLTVVLVIALVWPALAVMTVALCAMAARADRDRADAERFVSVSRHDLSRLPQIR
jgi:hypothetical protein